MRLQLIVMFFLSCICTMDAQVKTCHFDLRLTEAKENGSYEAFIEKIRVQLKNNPVTHRSERWLQVVVHVVLEDTLSISRAEIIQQIDVLNNDFAKKGENILKLNNEFAELAADTEIRFCLASTDPDGNPTNGITFTRTDQNNIALIRDFSTGRYVLYYDQFGGKSRWDPDRYINIWVAEFGNGILGYASLPGTAPFPEETGVVIDPLYFGSFGKGQPLSEGGHTLTHEMGHYLGLLHIWGDDEDSCDDSDEVDDTPNAAGPYLGCPSGMQVSCGESNMYENFMDLTDDRCLAAFTHGQSMRMHATLDVFYPGLDQGEPCKNQIQPFDQWWNDLLWSYDASSGEYILYTSDGYSGEIEIDIFSADGKRIRHDQVERQQSYLIDFDAVPGIYFVRILNGKEQHVKKISVY